MSEFLAKKTVGFYITVLATVLSGVCIALYAFSGTTLSFVYGMLWAAIAVEVLLIVLSKVMGNKPVLNLASSVCSVLLAFALVTSFNPQLDAIGYVVSGLYTFDQIKPFVIFVVFAAVTFLLYLVASFMDLGKEK